MNETVSVIVPIYKVEKYLRHCVESILAQTYQNLEVLLIDDGSPDMCGTICDEYAMKDLRVTVIHKRNGGLSSARNAGIERATGAYLLFVDSDDFIEPNMVRTLYDELQKDAADMALCAFRYVDERGAAITSPYDAEKYRKRGVWTKEQFWQEYCAGYTPAYTVAWNKLCRRRLFADLRYPEGKIREDEFVLHQLIEQCNCICIVPDQLYDYRQRTDGIMGSRLDARQLDKVEACLQRAEYFQKTGNVLMVKSSVFDAIGMLEWYRYECRRVKKALPPRYEEMRHEVLDFLKKPVQGQPLTYWAVVYSYRVGVFPYGAVRRLLDVWRAIRKRIG